MNYEIEKLPVNHCLLFDIRLLHIREQLQYGKSFYQFKDSSPSAEYWEFFQETLRLMSAISKQQPLFLSR